MITKQWIEGTVLYLVVSGGLDSIAADLLDFRLSKFFEVNWKRLVLDFSQVTYVHSRVINVLFELNNLAKAEEREVCIEGINDHLLGLFKTVKLNDLFPIRK